MRVSVARHLGCQLPLDLIEEEEVGDNKQKQTNNTASLMLCMSPLLHLRKVPFTTTPTTNLNNPSDGTPQTLPGSLFGRFYSHTTLSFVIYSECAPCTLPEWCLVSWVKKNKCWHRYVAVRRANMEQQWHKPPVFMATLLTILELMCELS